jgi:type I restriction enzyme M protein
MNDKDQKQLGRTLWNIADQLRGAMNADDFRDYMLAFLFLRYLSDNYEVAARKELGPDYPTLPVDDNRVPLAIWYANNPGDIVEFEKQMRRKVHYVIKPEHLWASIANLAKNQHPDLLDTLRDGFKYIENESFQSTFSGLFSEINLGSKSSARPMPTRTGSSATSSRRSPKGWQISPRMSTCSAMPTST